MNLLIVMCAVAVAVCAMEQAVFKIPPESLVKLHNFALPCAQEYNVDTSIIRQIGDTTFPRDEASSKFLYCYAKNSGFIYEDGHMVVEKIAGVLRDHPLKEKVTAILNKCNEETKENAFATVIAMHICYTKSSPIVYEF